MKSKLILILVMGLLVSPITAQAVPILFTASMDGLSEAAPNASPGTGVVTVTVFDDVTKTMRVEASFADLVGTTIAAHIHCCTPPGANAGVATSVPTFPGFPVGVTSGTYDMLFDMGLASSYNAAYITANGGTPDSAFAALFGGLKAGNAYFNLHSTAFPGGEIRANLKAQVPEPGTLVLLVLGLVGVGLRGILRSK